MSAKMIFEFKNYGFTTIGQKGQVVIPKGIRKKLDIKPGDKFLVICRDKTIISLIKPEKFDKMIAMAIGQLKDFKLAKK